MPRGKKKAPEPELEPSPETVTDREQPEQWRRSLWKAWLFDKVLSFADGLDNYNRVEAIQQKLRLVDKTFNDLDDALSDLSRICKGSGIDFDCPEGRQPQVEGKTRSSARRTSRPTEVENAETCDVSLPIKKSPSASKHSTDTSDDDDTNAQPSNEVPVPTPPEVIVLDSSIEEQDVPLTRKRKGRSWSGSEPSSEDKPVSDDDLDEDAYALLGRGLANNPGDNNCFLNVNVQALWHVPAFRTGLLSAPEHEHPDPDAPCISCALRQVFAELSFDMEEEPVDVSRLRAALYAQHNAFELRTMQDASECRQLILGSLHDERCRDGAECLAHETFGVMRGVHCDLCRGLQHHRVPANETEWSLEEILNSVAAPCSCGGLPLSAAPAVLAVDVEWTRPTNSAREATVKAIRTEITYRKEGYRLFCVVSHYSFHYTCFCLGETGWVHWDDTIPTVYRRWEDVVVSKDLRFPTTLFYQKRSASEQLQR